MTRGLIWISTTIKINWWTATSTRHPEAGLLIFMPDLDILPKTSQTRNVSRSG